MTGMMETFEFPIHSWMSSGERSLLSSSSRTKASITPPKSRAQKTHGQVQDPAWLAGSVGHQGRIDDADVGRLRSGRDARFLDLGVERIVEVHFGLHFFLERGVSRHLSDFFGGAFHLRCHQLFARFGCRVAGPHGIDDGVLLAVQLALQFIHLALQLLRHRVIGSVDHQRLGKFSTLFRQFLAQLLHHRIVADLGKRIGIAVLVLEQGLRAESSPTSACVNWRLSSPMCSV